MPTCKLILFERGNDWRRALRICAPGLSSVIETRSLSECRGELTAARASVVGLALSPRDAVDVVEFLDEMRCFAPLALGIALAELDQFAAYGNLEWDLRAAGAAHVIPNRRSMNQFARIAQSHQAKFASSKSDQDSPDKLLDQIQASLPWEVG